MIEQEDFEYEDDDFRILPTTDVVHVLLDSYNLFTTSNILENKKSFKHFDILNWIFNLEQDYYEIHKSKELEVYLIIENAICEFNPELKDAFLQLCNQRNNVDFDDYVIQKFGATLPIRRVNKEESKKLSCFIKTLESYTKIKTLESYTKPSEIRKIREKSETIQDSNLNIENSINVSFDQLKTKYDVFAELYKIPNNVFNNQITLNNHKDVKLMSKFLKDSCSYKMEELQTNIENSIEEERPLMELKKQLLIQEEFFHFLHTLRKHNDK